MAYSYDFKVVVSGKQVEVFKYKKSVWREFKAIDDEKLVTVKQLDMFEQEKLKQQRIKFSINRTKTEMRRLINSNPNLNKFMTLTFATSTTDITKANYLFNQFIKRITYRYPDFEYIAVPEYQKDIDYYGRKKKHGGSVHYHLLCNLPYIEMNHLEYIWRHGMVNIRKTGKVNNLGAYMSKYLGKELFSGRMFGKKKFFRSQDLKNPVELIGWYANLFVQKFLSWLTPVFEKTFYSKWVKEVEYKAFTLDSVPFMNGFERDVIYNST